MPGKKDIGVDYDFLSNKLFNKGEESVGGNAIFTPVSFSIDQNDYNPAGLQDASILRVSASANNRNITGLVAPNTARWKQLILMNVGSFTFNLLHNSALSVVENRFLLANSQSIGVRSEGVIRLIYDQTSQRWRANAV